MSAPTIRSAAATTAALLALAGGTLLAIPAGPASAHQAQATIETRAAKKWYCSIKALETVKIRKTRSMTAAGLAQLNKGETVLTDTYDASREEFACHNYISGGKSTACKADPDNNHIWLEVKNAKVRGTTIKSGWIPGHCVTYPQRVQR